MASVGIDIGTYSIKIAEVTESPRGFSVNSYKEYPLSPDPNTDRKIEIVDLLRNELAHYPPESTKFILAIPQKQISTHIKSFPFKERFKILKSLPFELEDDLPFDMMNTVFEAKITYFANNLSQVLAIACPKDNIKEMLNLANDCNIEPEILSAEGLAFSNLFLTWRESPLEKKMSFREEENSDLSESQNSLKNSTVTEVEVVLDLGHETSILILLKEGTILDLRNFDWGGKDIATYASKKSSQHYLETLKSLKTHAEILLNDEGADSNKLKLSNAIKESVSEFSDRLNLVLLELKSEHNLHYKHIVLVGGCSLIKNIGPYITQHTEIPTNRLKQLKKYPELDFENNENSAIKSTVAIGLAMEGIKKPKNPATNLLKGEFAQQSQELHKIWQKWSYTAKIAVAVFVLCFIYGIIKDSFSVDMLEASDAELKKQAQKVAGLKGRKASLRNVNRFIKEQKQIKKRTKITESLNNINSALDIINNISKNTASRQRVQININKMLLTNEEVYLEGEARNKNMVKMFMNTLKQSSKNNRVDPAKGGSSLTQGWVPFAYKIRVNRRSGS